MKKQKSSLSYRVNLRSVLVFMIFILNLGIASSWGYVIYINEQGKIPHQEITVGLSGEALVLRDNDGVPYIKANSLEDLFFVQGYIEAQDRLFQCDLARHVARGTLSSILGKSQLESDVLVRTIGIPEIANATLSTLTEYVHNYLKRYIDGMNFYLKRNKGNLPFEYDLLKINGLPMDYKPENFSITDSISVLLYLSFAFNSNFGFNIYLEDFISKIGLETFNVYKKYLKVKNEYNISQEDLFTKHLSRSGSKLKSHGDFSGYLPVFRGIFGENRGSNSWVVSGDRTLSGKPILCNDPHLLIGNPGILKSWYLSCPARDFLLIGAQLPLLPGILIGKNSRVAWGLTASFFDCGDAWREMLDENNTHYFYNGSWHQLNEKLIQIRLLDGSIYETVVKRVPGHGVLIDINGQTVSFRWSAMIDTRPKNDGSTMFNAFFKLFLANDSEDVLPISDPDAGWDDFPINLVYATVDGDIGYLALGRIPIRANHRIEGAIPLDGTDPGNDWVRW
ncbi:MAG: penicillin acylase family protein, partial [Promethearchaeota archaeon]